MMDLWRVAGRRAVLAGRRSIRCLVRVVGHVGCERQAREKRKARESEDGSGMPVMEMKGAMKKALGDDRKKEDGVEVEV